MNLSGSFPGDSNESGSRRPIVGGLLVAYWEANMNDRMNHAQQWATRRARYGPSGAGAVRKESIPAADRFWSKVEKGPSCWEWKAGKIPQGYGEFWYRGKGWRAPRAAWMFTHGKEPPREMHVCHTCDNPGCVRPDHLFLGTQKDNIQDCVSKGRQANARKTHCIHGHPYSGSNLFFKGGSRECRECWRKNNREAHKRRMQRRRLLRGSDYSS